MARGESITAFKSFASLTGWVNTRPLTKRQALAKNKEVMELEFSITSGQLKRLAKRVNSERVAKNATLALRLHAFIMRILFFWLPLLSPAIIYCSIWKDRTLEAYIAIAICAILYLSAWKRLIKAKVESRVSNFSDKTNALDYAVEALTARRLAAMEGNYKAVVTPKALRLAMPNGKFINIKWRKICCLKEDGDFYCITIRRYIFFKVAYLISKNGDIADARIQTALEEIFSRLSSFTSRPGKSSKA